MSKKIVILGSGVAGVKAAEKIREQDSSSVVTIVSSDGHYPCRGEKFSDVIVQKNDIASILYRQPEFYEQKNIDVIRDKKIIRINLKKNCLVTSEKEQIEYDYLILNDLPNHKMPEVKCKNKIGAMGFKRVSDFAEILKMCPESDAVSVESDSLTGLKLALAFKDRKKDSSLILANPGIFSWALDEESSQWLTALFREQGINIFADNFITELLGEADLKAVKLNTGKVIASQMVLFERTIEDYRIINDSQIEINHGILVSPEFRTSVENVFAVGNLCEQSGHYMPSTPWNLSFNCTHQEYQGEIVASAILGKKESLISPVSVDSLDLEGISLVFIGRPMLKKDIRVQKLFQPDQKIFKSLYYKDGQIVGAVLVNANEDIDILTQIIEGKEAFVKAEDILSSQGDRGVVQSVCEFESTQERSSECFCEGRDPESLN